MPYSFKLSFTALFTLSVATATMLGSVGCSDSAPTSQAVGASSNQAGEINSVSASAKSSGDQGVNKQEVAQAAHAFLSAIINGQQSAAQQWLTPAAVRHVQSNPELLQPLGFKVEKLEVGRVLAISATEAAVEFQLQEQGATKAEEICCIMKRTGQHWGVAGIACDSGSGAAPSIISFENLNTNTTKRSRLIVQGTPSLEVPSGASRTADRNTDMVK